MLIVFLMIRHVAMANCFFDWYAQLFSSDAATVESGIKLFDGVKAADVSKVRTKHRATRICSNCSLNGGLVLY